MAVTEIGAVYVLTGPNGIRAVFNDQNDPDYVGMLTEVTGFDSPEVRESAEDLVQADGGVHGPFFYGRRPLTLSGLVLNPTTAAQRNVRLDKLSAAADAMRTDGQLTWTPSGGVASYVKVRRQQPLRVSGAWQKQFQVALVAADPRIYSVATSTASVSLSGAGLSGGTSFNLGFDTDFGLAIISGQVTATNAGTTTTYPTIRVTGPVTNPILQNFTTGEMIPLVFDLAAGDYLDVDTLNKTVTLNGGASRYSAVDFTRTSWWGLRPGANDIRFLGDVFSTGNSMALTWRGAWI